MNAANPPDGSPAILSAWLAVCLAAIGWASTVPWSIHGVATASIGWFLLALALLVGDRTVLTVGAAGLVLAVFVSAGDGAGVATVLTGTTASILAWDIGHNAISVGRQLGREAPTVRAELAHALASLTAGCAIVVLGTAGSLLVAGTQPLLAVALLLLAGALIAVALAPRETLSFEWPS
ncbi:hypothetical protein D8Y22_07385 [Salinadaptatus halalkaliphilus]|uniref:Uncharacterized protein n=1 Tax=Salinadaptatus halalkaliphilus TaxID=2419781 RepID=A0A4S3TLJ0_9EURY|nr:hypothetical protein [Salinadaptatus halalkaliphilus]THE65041.1 hypothetical protein D8Y22_07385 [Salinadaptatus halalkaliphilus]